MGGMLSAFTVEALRRIAGYRFQPEFVRLMPDVDAVNHLASVLQISEFQLFHIAYLRWYGHDIPDRELDGIFSGYMFRNSVPFWMRSFIRDAGEQADKGTLRPEDFGIETPRHSRGQRVLGYIYIVLFSIFIGFYCYAAINMPPY